MGYDDAEQPLKVNRQGLDTRKSDDCSFANSQIDYDLFVK